MDGAYYHTLVVGSGCAGFNAADWLYDLGIKNIALITEGVQMGTSRNTGSDKQTYYKLSLAGDEPDSVGEMARTLFAGGSVHGDTALTEAAGSVRSFMKLVNLGVPFPTNAYGAYVGYKTDHDPRRRATSCGPLTSRLMTEALERAVQHKKITLLDNRQAVKILTENGQVRGLAVIRTEDCTYEVYACENIILATGGPAGIYHEVVYPESQTGATGLAIDAGAEMTNLQEWQYGLASTDFRWNVSGTYQQVLPRYISVDAEGREHEFLPAYFDTPAQALDLVFLKGYQWPFDSRKKEGSSQIDLWVSREIHERNRTVYMDFRVNPMGLEQGFDGLSAETRDYLTRSGAIQNTPIERLAHMNPKAIELYQSHGIDLWKTPLKVAVCAQHCNGGASVDINYESTIKGLYVVGEAAGTFGTYRPGGSALNAAQVGSMRAAEHIARKAREVRKASSGNNEEAEPQPHREPPAYTPPDIIIGAGESAEDRRTAYQKRMSRYAAYRRQPAAMRTLYEELCDYKERFFLENPIPAKASIPFLLKSYDLLLTQIAVLSAMLFSAEHMGSRGGAMVEGAPDDRGDYDDRVVVTLDGVSRCKPVRPLPAFDDWFENVWREFNAQRL